MPGILPQINKLAFVIAPVFWNMVYRSIVAVIVGCIWITFINIFDKYFSPNAKAGGIVCIIAWTLLMPDYGTNISVMKHLAPIADISYRQDYDVISQQVHIASQTYGDDMIDGLTDIQLMAKEKEIFYKSLTFDVIIPLLWLAFAIAGIIWIILSTRQLNKKIKTTAAPVDRRIMEIYEQNRTIIGVKKSVSVLFTDIVTVPATTGYFRPKILLPQYVAQLDDASIKYILLHELAHIKRQDIIGIYLNLILQAVYWFNPLLKILFNYQRQCTELMTDKKVVENIADKKEYAATMVRLLAFNTEKANDYRVVSTADSVKNMKQRIANINRTDFFKENDVWIVTLYTLLLASLWMFFRPYNRKPAENNQPPDFDKGIYSTVVGQPENWSVHKLVSADEKVGILCDIPDSWTFDADGSNITTSGIPTPYMAFHSYDSSMNIYEDDQLIGYVFFRQFTPYTEEIPDEKYHETVWPDLRLSSMCIWDPFTSVKQWESGESGICDIYYTDLAVLDRDNLTNAEAPHYMTKGVLAYDKAKEYYIGFGFAPNTVSDRTVRKIADSIVFQ